MPRELRETGKLCLVSSALDIDGEIWLYTNAWVTQQRVKGIRRRWRENDGLYGVILDQVGELVTLWRAFQAEPAVAEVAERLGYARVRRSSCATASPRTHNAFRCYTCAATLERTECDTSSIIEPLTAERTRRASAQNPPLATVSVICFLTAHHRSIARGSRWKCWTPGSLRPKTWHSPATDGNARCTCCCAA